MFFYKKILFPQLSKICNLVLFQVAVTFNTSHKQQIIKYLQQIFV